MFYDIEVRKGEVIVRKVFPKKRKRNKIAGLERNYVAREKKYLIKKNLRLHIPANGRVVTIKDSGETMTFKLMKGDTVIITPEADVIITSRKKL